MFLALLPGRISRLVVLLLGSPAILLGAPEIDEAHRVLVDGARDVMTERAFVPSERNVHGEVRVLRRDGAVCVQTLLYSRILRRGIAGIEKKEREAWPSDHEGFDDSSEYLTSLESASKEILDRWETNHDPSDAKQKMAIEFVMSDTKAFYAIYDVKLTDSSDGMQIEDKDLVVLRDASPSYVSRAMRLMVSSAFHIDDSTARKLLATGDDSRVVR